MVEAYRELMTARLACLAPRDGTFNALVRNVNSWPGPKVVAEAECRILSNARRLRWVDARAGRCGAVPNPGAIPSSTWSVVG